jgi:hypothetical protein
MLTLFRSSSVAPIRITIGALLWYAIGTAALSAQVLRGPVLLSDSVTRASGVIVLATDRSGVVVARSLTNEHGEYILRPPQPGFFTVRVLRIGFKPTILAPLELVTGEDRTLQILLHGERIALSAVTVRGQNVCRIRQDSGQVVAGLWEEAQKSLTATQISSQDRSLQSRWLRFDRTADPSGDTVRTEHTIAREAATDRPFISFPPDELALRGYVRKEVDGGMTFSAPDADALLSEQFAALHCFHVEPPTKDRTGWIGIGFKPARERRSINEIEGTLWLDRQTAELRLLEYRYTNLDYTVSDAGARGFVEFSRLASGIWFVSRWAIFMPHIGYESVAGRSLATSGRELSRVATPVPVMDELRISGGEVSSIKRGATELFRREGTTLDLFVRASDDMLTAAGSTASLVGTDHVATIDSTGHIRFEHLMAGRFRVRVTSPAMSLAGAPPLERIIQLRADGRVVSDSIALPSAAQLVTSVCGSDVLKRDQALIVGTVSSATSLPLAGARLSISWQDKYRKVEQNGLSATNERRDIAASDSGSWQLCGAPRGRTMTVRLMQNDLWSELGKLTVEPDRPFAMFALQAGNEKPSVLAAPSAVASVPVASGSAEGQGDLEGHVFATDSGRRALAGAHLELPAAKRTATSDAQGRFTLTDLPAGKHLVVIGKLGMGAESTYVTIPGGQVLVQEFEVHQPMTTLGEVKVVAAAKHPDMSGFADRREEGIGRFIDREALAKVENRTTGMVLSSLGGVRVWQGGTQAFVSSTRGGSSANCGFCAGAGLRPEDLAAGARPACYMDVYVDGALVYQQDINPPMALFELAPI